MCLRKNSIAFSSHVIAFVAYSLLEKMNRKLDIYGIIRLPEEDRKISFKVFKGTVENVVNELKQKAEKGETKLDRILYKSVDEVIEHGLYHLGICHDVKVIKKVDDDFINFEDVSLLYFYHNRLTGFGLKEFV